MVQMLHVNSKLVQLHANDLIDYRIIQNGTFVPEIQPHNVRDVIAEIIQIINWTLQKKELKIEFGDL